MTNDDRASALIYKSGTGNETYFDAYFPLSAFDIPLLYAAVRACIIFNPTAKGDKARHFFRRLDDIGAECALKKTSAPGHARRLAAEAVREGFETIVAAGGDGTVNEVLNGIGDVPDGFENVRLGLLPLGTVNVFARELKISAKLETALRILRTGRETKID